MLNTVLLTQHFNPSCCYQKPKGPVWDSKLIAKTSHLSFCLRFSWSQFHSSNSRKKSAKKWQFLITEKSRKLARQTRLRLCPKHKRPLERAKVLLCVRRVHPPQSSPTKPRIPGLPQKVNLTKIEVEGFSYPLTLLLFQYELRNDLKFSKFPELVRDFFTSEVRPRKIEI